jgi:hypothetical protein
VSNKASLPLFNNPHTYDSPIILLMLQDSSNGNIIQFFQLPLSLRSVALTPSGMICIVKFYGFLSPAYLSFSCKVTCFRLCNFFRSSAGFLPTVYFYISSEYAGFCWKSLSHHRTVRLAKVYFIFQSKFWCRE